MPARCERASKLGFRSDTEALDLLEGEKHRVFVGPAIGLPYAVRESLTATGADPKLRELVERSLAAAVRTYEQMRKRGIRVVIGGDYGFDITPQGANARDIEHFVKLSATARAKRSPARRASAPS